MIMIMRGLNRGYGPTPMIARAALRYIDIDIATMQISQKKKKERPVSIVTGAPTPRIMIESNFMFASEKRHMPMHTLTLIQTRLRTGITLRF